MKTYQEIKERLKYIEGYRDALYRLEGNLTVSIDEDIAKLRGQVKVLEWVLEVKDGNK